MLRSVSPVGPGRWYGDFLSTIRSIAGGIHADRSFKLPSGWIVTYWEELPGIYCISWAGNPNVWPTTLHFVANNKEAELWLMLNLPPQATVEEISGDQYPSDCFR